MNRLRATERARWLTGRRSRRVRVERIAGRADGRDDDDRATVRRRPEQSHRNTAPVIDQYARPGLLHRIDASRPVEHVYDEARAPLSSLS
jgi:adenylate kinase family enzyme